MAESKSAEEMELEKFGYKQELKRSLNVWELTAFGINYMIPIAPAIIFGFIFQISGGTVALPYALAGVAMMFTAMSYAVMVRNYPLAGSIYNYVGRGIQRHVGFLAGWVLILDYILIPTVTAMSASLYIEQFYPQIPYAIWLLIFAGAMGLLNLFGVELMAKLGLWMVVIGEVVIFLAFGVWAYYVAVRHGGTGTLLSIEPFRFSSFSALMSATSVCVLSYLGFDAITTLAEETNHPKRDVPRAIYGSILIGAFTMVLTGYLGMLVIPNWQQYVNNANWLATALMQVSKIAGGQGFAAFYTAGYLVAMGVFNVVATAAGARLLYGMGRDNLIPKSIFAAINQRWKTPHWNIILIVVIEYVLGITLTVESITNLINYGALGGFAALNLGVIWLYYVKKKGVGPMSLGEPENWKPAGLWGFIRYGLAPALGVIVVLWVFSSLDKNALKVGTTWLIIGIIYLAIKTKGFRELPPQLEL
ncbi:amino acid permease [Alicyclobacillaceae bacterium I2511]|nr:amino acid permease [Alicyclobacillaceae bacterium I2511]